MHHLPGRFHGDRPDRRFVLTEEGGVDLDGGLMFGRDVYIFEDRVHRTDDFALLAIDAHFGIDVELGRPRLRMDAGDRADLDARSIVGAQTGDDVRHGLFFLSQVQDVQMVPTVQNVWDGLNDLNDTPYPSGASGKSVRITFAT